MVALYQKYWADLDGPYWRAYVKRGRQVVPRIDIFVNYWLVMRLVQEVRADQIFASFRDHLLDAGPRIEDLLRELARDARTYAAINVSRRPRHRCRVVFCYRVFGALDAGAVTPFYLWLMRWPADRLPIGAARPGAGRRGELGGAALAVRDVQQGHQQPRAGAAPGTRRGRAASTPATSPRRSCSGSGPTSRVWPGDDHAVRKALRDRGRSTPAPLRPRLRMLLEAIEDRRRTEKSEGAPANAT